MQGDPSGLVLVLLADEAGPSTYEEEHILFLPGDTRHNLFDGSPATVTEGSDQIGIR